MEVFEMLGNGLVGLITGAGEKLEQVFDVGDSALDGVKEAVTGIGAGSSDAISGGVDFFGSVDDIPPPPPLMGGSGMMGVETLLIGSMLASDVAFTGALLLGGGWFACGDDGARATTARVCNPRQFTFPRHEFTGAQLARGRVALLVGINYLQTPSELRGCGNDVCLIYNFLVSVMGFVPEDIIVLTDDDATARRLNRQLIWPTAEAILKAYDYVRQYACAVAEADGRCAVICQYSGHGTSVKDLDGDEADGLDEAIVPIDVNVAGVITDDIIYHEFLAGLPAACEVTALFDCCHSGTILDLQYSWLPAGAGGVVKCEHNLPELAAYVQLISGCLDKQYSADTHDKQRGVSAGAMTSAFLDEYSKRPNGLVLDLVHRMGRTLKARGFTQVPEFSCSRMFDTNTIAVINLLRPSTGLPAGAQPEGGPRVVYAPSKVDLTVAAVKKEVKKSGQTVANVAHAARATAVKAHTEAVGGLKTAGGKVGSLFRSKKHNDAATVIQRAQRRRSSLAQAGVAGSAASQNQ